MAGLLPFAAITICGLVTSPPRGNSADHRRSGASRPPPLPGKSPDMNLRRSRLARRGLKLAAYRAYWSPDGRKLFSPLASTERADGSRSPLGAVRSCPDGGGARPVGGTLLNFAHRATRTCSRDACGDRWSRPSVSSNHHLLCPAFRQRALTDLPPATEGEAWLGMPECPYRSTRVFFPRRSW